MYIISLQVESVGEEVRKGDVCPLLIARARDFECYEKALFLLREISLERDTSPFSSRHVIPQMFFYDFK